jgi:two-component system chemotaxis response regulator CheB
LKRNDFFVIASRRMRLIHPDNVKKKSQQVVVQQSMNERRPIVVVGTSIGGLRALKHLAARLPANFPTAILVVMQTCAQESVLPRALSPYCGLSVRYAIDGEEIQSGRILIGPPDYHLMVDSGCVRLWHGPKENLSRPAADPLFRSAALAYGSKVIGVVLTGNLDDGTIGLQAIKACGGVTIVQDPAEAEAPGMPLSAIEHVDVDYCLPLDRIVDVLGELVEEPVGSDDEAPPPASAQAENRFSSTAGAGVEEPQKTGELSPFTCPECHGSLWEIAGPRPLRFQCHIGHRYTARALALAQNQLAEEATWAAIRALDEKEALLTRLASMEAESNPARAEHQAVAAQASGHAAALRKMISP